MAISARGARLFCYQYVHHGANTIAIKKNLQQLFYQYRHYLTVCTSKANANGRMILLLINLVFK